MKKQYLIAGHGVVLTAPDTWFQDRRLDNYRPFETDSPAPAILSLEVVETLESQEGFREVFTSEDPGFPAFHILRNDAREWRFLVSPLPEEPVCSEIAATADFSSARLLLKDPALVRFALDNALMVLYALRTAPLSTLEMHASVVMHRGKGYLFLGRSGTGKSTHSRLWRENIPEVELLNDDNPLLRVLPDGSVRVYGSPWSGKTPCYKAKDVPVGVIVRIEQAPYNRITRLPLIQAYASVYPSCSAFRPVKEVADGLHESLTRIAASTPCYRLECLPDAEAALLCHKTVCDG